MTTIVDGTQGITTTGNLVSTGGLAAGGASSISSDPIITATASQSITNKNIVATQLTGRLANTVLPANMIGQIVRNSPTPNIYTMTTSSYAEVTTTFRTSITPLYANSLLQLDFVCLVGANDSSAIYSMKFYDVTNNADINPTSGVGSARVLAHCSTRQVEADANDRDNMMMRAYVSATNTTARTYSIYQFSEAANAKYIGATPTDNSGCTFVPSHFTITEIFQ